MDDMTLKDLLIATRFIVGEINEMARSDAEVFGGKAYEVKFEEVLEDD